LDKIIIKGLKVFAYHGVNPEEKEEGQNFILDVSARLDLTKAGQSDNLDDTVSYAKMIKVALAVMQSQKNDLIERAAHRVARALLENFPDLDSVKVKLKKPEAPVKAHIDYAAVELELKRSKNTR
jgi:dihydroneopterin aldolase